jgi:REP element-mobilizing transposase RayT
MTYDPDRDHRRSIRLRDYDYSSAGAYFVTILVKQRECPLGEVVDGEMRLSEIGEIVRAVWDSLPQRYPGVELDEFGIMPNHTHGIIVIMPEAERAALQAASARAAAGVEIARPDTVRAVHEPPLRRGLHTPPPSPAPATAQDRRRMLLPKIIGYFKMNTAKRANLLRDMSGQPFWHRDYYEHVIRNRAELERIREYIANNPLKWELDQLHPDVPSKW